MFNNPKINIQCEGSTTVSLDELKELHTYKDLSDEAYTKARQSIINLGFSFPIPFWEDKDGTKYILDGHQRKRVLMKLRSEEGFEVPPLPAVRVFAEDRKEAKKKLLAQESSYGTITEEGLYEFINEEGFELDEGELDTFVEIEEFTFEQEAAQTEEQPTEFKPTSCDACKKYHEQNHVASQTTE